MGKKVDTAQVAKMADVTTMTVIRWKENNELHGELVPKENGGYIYQFELEEVLNLLEEKRYNYLKKSEMYLRKVCKIEKSLRRAKK